MFFCRGANAAPCTPGARACGILYWQVVCACVVVVRLMCRKVSPSAAFSGDRRDEICSTSATLGKKFPRPLAAACNARRNSYGATAILELEICHCSNISFEQWIFFACQSFQVNLFYAEKRPPQNIRFCAQPHFYLPQLSSEKFAVVS